MSIAPQIEPHGDPEIIAAQKEDARHASGLDSQDSRGAGAGRLFADGVDAAEQ